MGILTNIGGGLALESTTVETTTYALAAGKTARIIPQSYKSAIVFDDTANGGGTEELMPQLVYTRSSGGAVGTTDQLAFICPEGHELTGHISIAGNGAGGGAVCFIKDVHDGIVNYEPLSVSVGTSPTSYTIVATHQKLLSKEHLYFRSTVAGHGINSRYHFRPTDEWMRTNHGKQEFFVYGGASGATITGDEFIVEVYG